MLLLWSGVSIFPKSNKSQKILNALILLGCDAGEFQTRSTKEEKGLLRPHLLFLSVNVVFSLLRPVP